MTDLTQYTSPSIDGLQVVIDHQTGKVYASQKALARLTYMCVAMTNQ